MAALQDRGVQFELMTYPGGKHGLSTPAMKKHVYHLIADYFDAKVKRGTAGEQDAKAASTRAKRGR